MAALLVHRVDVTGTRVTTGVASKTAIPVGANGSIPRYVAVYLAQASSFAYVRPTQNANGANTDPVVTPSNSPLIFNTVGYSHIGHLQGSAAEVITIVPLEDARL